MPGSIWLTGEAPTIAHTPDALNAKLSDTDVAQKPGLADAILRALSIDAGDRHQSAADLRVALNSAV